MRYLFQCLDGHTCGNPVRLVTSGAPDLQGASMLEKRDDFIARFDWIRTGLMFEPRGHDMMSGGFLYPSTRDDCDIAVLYIETSGCLPMCGHGTMGIVTMAIENGLVRPRNAGVLMLDTPAGPVEARYEQAPTGKVKSVTLKNVPSFLYQEAVAVEHPDLGSLIIDIAYGGNFYAIVDPQKNFHGLDDVTASALIGWSRALRSEVNRVVTPKHPNHDAISGIRHIMWTGAPLKGGDGRNAVFYGEGAIDRSPCGTGTSARLAQLHAKGHLPIGQPYRHESIIGSEFTGTIIGETRVGDKAAIIPSVQGWAIQTGINSLFIDDDDPFYHGFSVN